PVVGYEGWYEVSSFGRVRRVMSSKGSTVGLILKASRQNNGAFQLRLTKRRRQRNVCVSRLVAEAFIGPPPYGADVRHKDGNKDNCRVMNLEYWRYAIDLPGEEWKPVIGWRGWYEVSSIGRVRRVKAIRGTRAGTLLRPYTPNTGYPVVNFSKPGIEK